MGFSRSLLLAASLAAASVLAAPCAPESSTPTSVATGAAPAATSATPPTPTIPTTGVSSLPVPPASSTLLYVAIGHGIQNYTCASSTANATSVGALALLYDITAFYPGTPNTGLTADGFESISASVLWSQDLAVNLVDESSAKAPGAGASNSSTGLPETAYAANVADPFPSSPAALTLGGPAMETAPFLGVHYFDAAGSPTFDLSNSPSHAFFSGAKAGGIKAPTSATKGLLQTGAVDWLQLADSGKGLSKGVSYVYRVVTAGGAAQACGVSGAGQGSVPYTAQYWFYS